MNRLQMHNIYRGNEKIPITVRVVYRFVDRVLNFIDVGTCVCMCNNKN